MPDRFRVPSLPGRSIFERFFLVPIRIPWRAPSLGPLRRSPAGLQPVSVLTAGEMPRAE